MPTARHFDIVFPFITLLAEIYFLFNSVFKSMFVNACVFSFYLKNYLPRKIIMSQTFFLWILCRNHPGYFSIVRKKSSTSWISFTFYTWLYLFFSVWQRIFSSLISVGFIKWRLWIDYSKSIFLFLGYSVPLHFIDSDSFYFWKVSWIIPLNIYSVL